jgi:hypothetical protein
MLRASNPLENLMSVSGTWQGEYLFEEGGGDKEAASIAGHIIGFTMQLSQGWLGMVSGTVQDDKRTGYTEEGKIKGKAKGRSLEFRRVMPVLRFMHESSRITLEQWAERRKIVIDTDRASPPLLFEGQLSEDGNSIAGTWKLPGQTIEIPGSYQHLVIPTVGGTWKARRQ